MAGHPSSSCPALLLLLGLCLCLASLAGLWDTNLGEHSLAGTEGEAKSVLWRHKWSCGLTCSCLCCCESSFPFVLVLRSEKLLWWCWTGRVIHPSLGCARCRRVGSSLWHPQCKTGDTPWVCKLCAPAKPNWGNGTAHCRERSLKIRRVNYLSQITPGISLNFLESDSVLEREIHLVSVLRIHPVGLCQLKFNDWRVE